MQTMKEFFDQLEKGTKNLEGIVGRKLTGPENNMMFMNLLRMKLGLRPIQNSFLNKNRFNPDQFNKKEQS